MSKKIFSYEKRVVAFIDILAFKELIKKTEKNISHGQDLLDALAYMQTSAKTSQFSEVTAFSDCIVISYPLEERNIYEPVMMLIGDLAQLSNRLLQKGIFIRGAITTGLLYHKNNIVFGQALIDAYYLESECTHYPRIIIEESVFNYPSPQLRHNQHLTTDNPVYTFVAHPWTLVYGMPQRDFDGYYFIDYLSISHLFTNKGEAHKIYMLSVRKKIIENHNQVSDFGKKSKWRWMANYFNSVIEKTNSSPSNYFIEVALVNWEELD